ncbi:MAG: Mrp/NBP35 family ATP-binding protein [Actinobacteria bacterium]|nr:Mrp/NBP35 family ATP-binding protein [Actinomycetota bacterium]MCL6104406.1 Mrp/NBP35 family ATP-binding protein [Actinomycetota bacterium]
MSIQFYNWRKNLTESDSTTANSITINRVQDPLFRLAIEELGFIKSVKQKRNKTEVVINIPEEENEPPYPGELKTRIETAFLDGVSGSDSSIKLQLRIDLMDDTEREKFYETLHFFLKNKGDLNSSRTRVIGISSGKGGVGKSSVTINLAVALSQLGKSVAILDADVYGFSIPKMLGVQHQPSVLKDIIIPPVEHGIACISLGLLVEDDQPVVWRGPMLHKTLEQFIKDVWWAAPDFFLIDMPPGTGDVSLSLAQYLPRSEILVVTTPQPAAQRVAQRSAYAAQKLNLPVKGVIENMSWFTGNDGVRYEIFGSGGGAMLAKELGVDLLGQVPLLPAMRSGADDGVPIAILDPASEASRIFEQIAKKLIDTAPTRRWHPELKVTAG